MSMKAEAIRSPMKSCYVDEKSVDKSEEAAEDYAEQNGKQRIDACNHHLSRNHTGQGNNRTDRKVDTCNKDCEEFTHRNKNVNRAL